MILILLIKMTNPNVIRFSSLINNLNTYDKIIIRQLEKLLYKLNNANNSVVFIKNCIEHGLFPTFKHVRTHARTHAHTQKHTHTIVE